MAAASVSGDPLIADLLKRVEEQLPTAPLKTEQFGIELKAQNEDALVKLAEFRHDVVVRGMAELLDRTKQSAGSDLEAVAASELYILRLMFRCLSFKWKCHKERLTEEQLAQNTDGLLQTCRDPPSLDPDLAQLILHQTGFFILSKHETKDEDLRKAAGDILSHLSASNFDVVFARIKAKINALAAQQTEEDPNTSDLRLMEYLNLNKSRLSELFKELSRSIRRFKKSSQEIIAVTLRKAIWNWIDAYPMEFVAVCQSGQKVRGNPDVLFDVFDELAETAKRKNNFWPLETMLLILCPDLFLKVQQNEDPNKMSNKANFLKNLEKSLKNDKLADVAVVSYVDMCKASTYVQKTDMSPLRYQIPTIERELKGKLFDVKRPFRGKDGVVELDLMVDCLTSLFRLNPRNVISDEFVLCYGPTSPPLFKMVLLKTLMRIAVEGLYLPWNPTVELAYASMSAPLRTLFQETLQRYRAPVDKKKKAVDPPTDGEILVQIAQLVRAHPTLFIYNTSTAAVAVEADTKQLFQNICFGLSDMENLDFYQACTQCLLEAFQPKYIEQWCPPSPIVGFWAISSSVLSDLSKTIISMKDVTDQNNRKRVLELMQLLFELLKRRNSYLSLSHRDEATIATALGLQSRMDANADLETCVLVTLCSGDVQISTLSAKCIGCMCEQVEFLSETGAERTPSISANFAVYKAISALSNIVGREHQQKEIRKQLRRIDRSTRGNIAAWDHVSERWQAGINLVLRLEEDTAAPGAPAATPAAPAKKPPKPNILASLIKNRDEAAASLPALPTRRRDIEDLRAEWLNYAGFLAATGGVMLNESRSQTTASGGIVPERPFDKFLDVIIKLMIGDAMYIRENIMKIVSSSLSPAVYAGTFKVLSVEMSRYFQDTRVVETETSTLFVEQAISVVRRILEGGESADELSLADFETLLLSFVQFISALVNNMDTARMKNKVCSLIELMMKKKHFITFRDEVAFRNRLVDRTVAWTSDFSDKKPSEALDEAEVMRVDVSIMKAVTALLAGLVMQPKEAVAESDLARAKTDLFLRYFTFFTRQLERCRRRSDAEAATLADLSINSLSNLLNANIDSGLEHFISQGYSEDLETRSAFLKVLTNILKQGAEFDALVDVSLTERYEQLMHLLLAPDNAVINALIDVIPGTESDMMASVLVRIFTAGGRINELLVSIISREVGQTTTEATLFRRNSMATKLLAAFCKQHGAEHLKATLLMPLRYIIDDVSRQYEVDPERASATEIAANTPNLINACQVFMDAIYNSLNSTPNDLRYICFKLADVVGARFPAAKRTAVAGFFFLRFMCPPIVSPEGFGLLADPITSKDTRRALVLITKVVQNLANRVAFGQKEAYMCVCNPFIETNIDRINQFLDTLAELPAGFQAPTTEAMEDVQVEDQLLDDLQEVHRLLHWQIDALGKRQMDAGAVGTTGDSEAPRGSVAVDEDAFGGKDANMSDQVVNKMGTLKGKPSAKPAVAAKPSATPPVANKPVRAAKPTPEAGALAAAASSAAGAASAAGNVNVGAGMAQPTSGELLQPVDTRSKISQTTFDQLTSILGKLGNPPDRADRKNKDLVETSTSGLGSNTLFQSFMTENANVKTDKIKNRGLFYQGGTSKAGRPVFYYIARLLDDTDRGLVIYHILKTLEPAMNKPFDLVLDLAQFSRQNEIQPSWLSRAIKLIPIELSNNISSIYVIHANHAFKRYAKRTLVGPVLGKFKKLFFCATLADMEQYIAAKENKLPSSTIALEQDVKATFTPVLNVGINKNVTLRVSSDMVQILSSASHNLFNQKVAFNDMFHIRQVEDVQPLPDQHHFFIKCQSDVAMKFVFAYKNSEQVIQSLKLSQAGWALTKENTFRKFRPEDVPGTLLNMALLNLGSDDPDLRMASYDLLYALAVSFNFSVRNDLLSADDMFIPVNTAGFVVNVSTKLAATEQRLTLEFLREVLDSFNKESLNRKHLCLQYMSPWLPNLAEFCRPSMADDFAEKKNRSKEIVATLLELTIRETNMYPSTQQHVWARISKVDDMLDLVIDSLVIRAVTAGFGSKDTELIVDTCITLATNNAARVVGRIMARLRTVLRETSLTAMKNLDEHISWAEITVLCRFLLMMSFHNHMEIIHFLPEVFHIIIQLVSTGPLLVRTTLHGIAVNVIQALCAADILTVDQKENLSRYLLRDFSQARIKLLFGVSGKQGAGAKRMPIASMESVAQALYDVLFCCQSADGGLGYQWQARLQSLTTVAAFDFNPALQPRAFVTLGVLTPPVVDDDLLARVLVQLRGTLLVALGINKPPGKYTQPANDFDSVISLLMCLAKFVGHLPASSRLFRSMFWIAVSVLQVGETELFAAGLALLDAVVLRANSAGAFDDTPFATYLMAARAPLEAACARIDEITQLSFTANFSFAVAGSILKGLKNPNAKALTLRVLSTFLDVAGRGMVNTTVLGYLAALLMGQGDVSQFRAKVAAYSEEGGSVGEYAFLFSKELLPNTETGVLLLVLLVTVLNNAEYENEQLFIYELLKEAVHLVPQVFSVTYEILVPCMSRVLATSQNLEIVDNVQFIMEAMVSDQFRTAASANTENLSLKFLKTIGFLGLPESASAVNADRKREVAKLCGQVIDLALAVR